jgi:hypothetical protein
LPTNTIRNLRRRIRDEIQDQVAWLDGQITESAQGIEQLTCIHGNDLLLQLLQNGPKSIPEDEVRLAYARTAAEQPLVKWKTQLETELRDLQKQLDTLR